MSQGQRAVMFKLLGVSLLSLLIATVLGVIHFTMTWNGR